MTLAILFSLQTMQSLKNGVATHFQATAFFSVRTESLASSQICRSTDDEAWCKRDLTVAIIIGLVACGIFTVDKKMYLKSLYSAKLISFFLMFIQTSIE